ncbi:hypothetical protein [Apilactobacillus timberlakei]|nr:hypothetical protein [Apilactobacillus timberlakei]
MKNINALDKNTINKIFVKLNDKDINTINDIVSNQKYTINNY